MSVKSIARRIVASENGNILDDYYRFYNDGKWVVNIIRRVRWTLFDVERNMADLQTRIPKLDECIGYMEDVKLDEMDTDSCAKILKKYLSEIKKAHSDWEKASEDEKSAKYDAFLKKVNEARRYSEAFQGSCINLIRNRYMEDEENVRNLLDAMNSAHDYANAPDSQNAQENQQGKVENPPN